MWKSQINFILHTNWKQPKLTSRVVWLPSNDHVDLYSISYGTALRYGRRAVMLQWEADRLCSLWALQLLPSAACLAFFPSTVLLSYSCICACVLVYVYILSVLLFSFQCIPPSNHLTSFLLHHSLTHPPNLTDLSYVLLFLFSDTYTILFLVRKEFVNIHHAVCVIVITDDIR
jgi:hypothetical protein